MGKFERVHLTFLWRPSQQANPGDYEIVINMPAMSYVKNNEKFPNGILMLQRLEFVCFAHKISALKIAWEPDPSLAEFHRRLSATPCHGGNSGLKPVPRARDRFGFVACERRAA